jgi:hypothetical protein
MKNIAAMFLALAVFAPLSAPASNAPVSGGASAYQSSSYLAPTVSALEPAPGARLRTFFPTLSASIDAHGRAPVRRSSLHLFVDGIDVTPMASITGRSVRYMPRRHLTQGWHDAFLEGADVQNHTFSDAWVFETMNPDVDTPFDGSSSSALLPIGFGLGGPFAHFFIVSPFNGFAVLQACGFAVPFTQAAGTPVFFATVPVTFGTAFIGCNPGIVFTPFGTGLGAPIFFPLQIAGPSIFQQGHPVSRLVQSSSMLPVYRTSTLQRQAGVIPRYTIPAPAALRPMGTSATSAMGLPGMHLPGTVRPVAAPAHPVALPAHPVLPVHP